MADKVSKSKYALKVARQNAGTYREPHGTTRAKRICDWCKLTLAGAKGHGFTINVGRTLICGPCAKKTR